MKSSSNRQGNPMFDILAELPLLRGASAARLSEVCGQMKIKFSKAAPGDTICTAGSECNGLIFILSGSVRVCRKTDGFELEYSLEAPRVISPEYLFGLSTTFPRTVTAISSVGFMEISKEDYRRMLSLDSVFLFNYLNILSACAQRVQTGVYAIADGCNPLERVGRWMDALVHPGARDIVLQGVGREPHQIFGISVASMRSVAEKLGAELDGNVLRMNALA